MSVKASPATKSVWPKAIIPMATMKTTNMMMKMTPKEPIFRKIARSFLLQMITSTTNKTRDT